MSFNLASTEFLIFSDASMAGKKNIVDFIQVKIETIYFWGQLKIKLFQNQFDFLISNCQIEFLFASVGERDN